MAEIIAEPTALSKVIPLKFKINDVDVPKTTQLSTNKQFNTTDTDAWFTFELDGLAATNGTYDLTLINLDDKSIFHHDHVLFPTLPFHYKLNSSEDVTLNEIRHAGRWLGQLVVTLSNGDTTARQFGFNIAGHILDGQDAQVILLSDYQALINTINLAKDDLAQYNVDYAALLVDIAAAEDARVTAYNQLLADQQANIEAFDVALDEGIVAANLAKKLQDFEETNNSRLLSTERQLAEAEYLSGRTLTNKVESKNGLVTFEFDDASISDYTVLKPIFTAKNVPACAAVITSKVGTANFCTKAQLLDLQALGWEMMSHSINHYADLIAVSDATSEAEFRDSKEWLVTNGFNVESFAYPYGYFGDREKGYAKKYYRSARAYGYGLTGLNDPPVETYELKTIFLTVGAMSNPSGLALDTFNHFKYYIDKAVAENKWAIITSHAADIVTNNLTALLEQVIDYAKSVSNVVTHKQALDKMGNLVDIGTFSKSTPYKHHTAIGHDGTLSTNAIDTIYQYDNFADGSTAIDKFSPYKVTVNRVFGTQATNSNMPDKNGGILYTYNFAPYNDVNQSFSYQIYHGFTSGEVFKRQLKYDKSWLPWFGIKDYIVNKTINTHTCQTPITSFAVGVTIDKISDGSATGSPNGVGGVLITYRVDNDTAEFGWQEYHQYMSDKVYRRRVVSGTFTAWIIENKSLNVVAPAVGTLTAGQTFEHTITDATITYDNTAVVNPKGTMPSGIVWNAQCTDGSVIIRVTNATSGSIVVPTIWWAVNVLGVVK